MSWENGTIVPSGDPLFGRGSSSVGVIAAGTSSRSVTFTNPLYKGADPCIVRRDGWYYLCQAGPGGRLEIWRSRTLTQRGERRIVWTPPRTGWNRAQIWAPELHYLRGRWYIYYAASNGRNSTHRMGV